MLRGLARDDLFTVVHEQVLTDTAALADVVLPCTTHFEADDIAHSYGSFTLQRMRPAHRAGRREPHERRGRRGARRRLGFPAASFDPDPGALLERVVLDGGGADGARVLREPAPRCSSPPCSRRSPIAAPASMMPRDRCRRPSTCPLETRVPADPDQPGHEPHDQLDARRGAAPPRPSLAMSPSDAAARRVTDGDTVRLWNDQASLEVPCRIDAGVRPGSWSLPKGLWRRHVAGGLTANAPGARHDRRPGRRCVLQ